jgi:hypothetical protein
MGAPICTTGSTIMCPHGGTVLLVTSNVVAKIQGMPALLETDIHPVIGCPFTVGPKYQPCVTVRWANPATQTKVGTAGVLLQSSIGTCYSAEQAPQGVAVISQVQPIATGL